MPKDRIELNAFKAVVSNLMQKIAAQERSRTSTGKTMDKRLKGSVNAFTPELAKRLRDRLRSHGPDPSRVLVDDWPKHESDEPFHGIFKGLQQLDDAVDTHIWGHPLRS